MCAKVYESIPCHESPATRYRPVPAGELRPIRYGDAVVLKTLAKILTLFVALFGVLGLALSALVRRAVHWGSTPAEQEMELPGDGYLAGGSETRTVMTRAISISAPPEVVWPWLAQLGRGAGWYSYDRIDNGGRKSARHIVSWIPAPQIGDATAIGWLRELEPGRALTWWLPGDESFGTTMRMVVDIRLDPEGAGSRLVARISGDATGTVGAVVVRVFEAVDSLMAIEQLHGIKTRAETFGVRTLDPAIPDTGARDQYQLYEAIWRSGERAGTAGSEKAAQWRRDAEAAGAVSP